MDEIHNKMKKIENSSISNIPKSWKSKTFLYYQEKISSKNKEFFLFDANCYSKYFKYINKDNF